MESKSETFCGGRRAHTSTGFNPTRSSSHTHLRHRWRFHGAEEGLMARGSLTRGSVLASYISPSVSRAVLAGTARVPSEAASQGPPFPGLPSPTCLEGRPWREGPACFPQRLSIHPASVPLPLPSLSPPPQDTPLPGFRGALLSVTVHKARHSQARPTFQTMEEARGSVPGHAPLAGRPPPGSAAALSVRSVVC